MRGGIKGERLREREDRSGWSGDSQIGFPACGLSVLSKALPVTQYGRRAAKSVTSGGGLGQLSRSELVHTWLAIGEVDRWWGKGRLRSGWTGVCGSLVFGRLLIWAVGSVWRRRRRREIRRETVEWGCLKPEREKEESVRPWEWNLKNVGM